VVETIKRYLSNALKNETGQALGEYALVLGLVAMAAVIALGLLGTSIGGFFTDFISQAGFGSS
jgi:Flp pilus assembly pilin Flp